MKSVRSKDNGFMWVPKNIDADVAPLQSHSSTNNVTKKRMKYVAKKKKSTKNVSSHVTPNALIIAPASPVDSVSVNHGMLEKPLKKVVQETEVQAVNVVEETYVADNVPNIVFPIERKVGENILPVHVSLLSWTETLQGWWM